MRVLVDRCAGRRLGEWLREHGYDVLDVSEMMPDPGDRAPRGRACYACPTALQPTGFGWLIPSSTTTALILKRERSLPFGAIACGCRARQAGKACKPGHDGEVYAKPFPYNELRMPELPPIEGIRTRIGGGVSIHSNAQRDAGRAADLTTA